MGGGRPHCDVGVQVLDVELAGPCSSGGKGAHLGHRGALRLGSLPGQVLLCLQLRGSRVRRAVWDSLYQDRAKRLPVSACRVGGNCSVQDGCSAPQRSSP